MMLSDSWNITLWYLNIRYIRISALSTHQASWLGYAGLADPEVASKGHFKEQCSSVLHESSIHAMVLGAGSKG